MFSIYDNLTGKRVSEDSYATADEANRDYYMNEGHTHVGVVCPRLSNPQRKALSFIATKPRDGKQGRWVDLLSDTAVQFSTRRRLANRLIAIGLVEEHHDGAMYRLTPDGYRVLGMVGA